MCNLRDKEFLRIRTFLACFIFTCTIVTCRSQGDGQKCIPIDFGMGSVVCQCNSTYCDFYPDPEPPRRGKFVWYVTNQRGERLTRRDGKIAQTPPKYDTITIDTDDRYQEMKGFGGAFTDAACINIKKLSQGCQDNILRSYFAEDGSKYNLARVPIGGTDFSTRGYSYADVNGDVLLKHFTLANEDTEYKIPLMQKALELNPALEFFAAAWTAPPWMKSNNAYNGYGYLLPKYYQTYANYLVKFLETYKSYGLEMWAISTGNEPTTSVLPMNRINTMFWTPKTITEWLLHNYLPTLANSKANNTRLLVLDDQRYNLPWYMMELEKHARQVLKYVSGIALHWYFDDAVPPAALDITNDQYPDKFMLITEACLGFRPSDHPKVSLGSWDRFEELVTKMFENFNHWVTGWVDWNLALDTSGGPNWVDNPVDAPIIVLPELDIFYRQPIYYAMTHFSKFIPHGSFRVDIENDDDNILSAAFDTADGYVVVVVYNQYSEKKNISILDDHIGTINIELTEKSLNTIMYNNVI